MSTFCHIHALARPATPYHATFQQSCPHILVFSRGEDSARLSGSCAARSAGGQAPSAHSAVPTAMGDRATPRGRVAVSHNLTPHPGVFFALLARLFSSAETPFAVHRTSRGVADLAARHRLDRGVGPDHRALC